MNTLIFSVCKKDNTHIANKRNFQAALQLLNTNGVTYNVVEGCYDNTPELSIVVNGEHIEIVEHLCAMYEQECYLRINNAQHKESWLVFADGGEKYIGRFKSVCSWLAEKSGSYTRDSRTGTYYVCG